MQDAEYTRALQAVRMQQLTHRLSQAQSTVEFNLFSHEKNLWTTGGFGKF